jgi:hypothetical protein
MDRKQELNRNIKMYEGAQKQRKAEYDRVQAELDAMITELNQLKTDEWLADHDALDLQPGTELALCESFYAFQAGFQTERELLALFGAAAHIGSFNSENEMFSIYGWSIFDQDEDGYFEEIDKNRIGSIPLGIIRDMRQACLDQQAVK